MKNVAGPKRVEEELQERRVENIKLAVTAEERSELQDWINTFDTFVGKLDPNCIGIIFNESPLKRGGVTKDEVVGKYFPDTKWWTHSEIERARVVECFERAKAGLSSRIKTSFRSADGTPVPIIFNCQPVMDDDGNVKYITAEGKTIIEETRLYTELQEAKESLEARVRERTSELVEAVEKLEIEMAERKRAEEALKESEANLKRAQEVAHIGSWHLDILKNDLVWSDEIFRIFGVSADTSLTYEKFLEIIHPDDVELVNRSWMAALNKEPYDIEHRIIVNGEVKWVREKAEVEFDKEGKAIKGTGTVQDITGRKRAEEALHVKECAIATSISAIALSDLEGNLTYVNPSFLKMWGYEREDEVLGRQIHDLWEIAEKAEEVILSLRVGGAWVGELKGRKKDGTPFDVRVQANMVIDLTGEPICMMGSFADVTEQKATGKALRESEERFRVMTASAQDAIFMMDDEGNATYWNEAAERTFGYGRDDILGRDLRTAIVPRAYHDNFRKGLAESRCSGTGAEGKTLELTAKRANGSEFPIEMSISKVQFKGGVHSIGIIRDITERKKAKSELCRLNRALRALSECNQAVVRASDEDSLLHDICRIVVEIGGYRLSWVGYVEHDEAKTVRPVAQHGYEDGYLETTNITWADWADSERGHGPTGLAIRTGRASIARNILTNPEFEPWRAEAVKRGYASSAAIPLSADGRVFGTLNIYAEEADAFDPEEVALLKKLADDLAYGVTTIRVRRAHERADEALRESEERFRQVVENIDHVIWLTDWKNKKLLYVNPSYERVFGKSCQSLYEDRLSWYDAIHPDDREGVVKAFTGDARLGRITDVKYRVLGDDGSIRWVRDRAYPIRGPEGEICRFVGIAEDITGIKQAEEERARMLREKARSELHGFIVSAVPAFASGIPPKARAALVSSFANRFERNVKPRFIEAMAALDIEIGAYKSCSEGWDVAFTAFMLWVSGLFSNLGINVEWVAEGCKGHLALSNCPWDEDAKNNPIFCLVCRTMAMRSFTWISPDGSAKQAASIAGGTARCEFEFSFAPADDAAGQ